MNILFVGCGKMGSAIVNNLIKQKTAKKSQISILKPTKKNQINAVKYYQNIDQLIADKYSPDIVFIAVKPQNVKEILLQLVDKNIFNPKTIFISIVAGKKIDFFTEILDKKAKIIRSMPNMAIAEAKGIFIYQVNQNLTIAETEKLNDIFSKFGVSYEIRDEKLFDPLTAIFASGPAYLFLLQEIICEIAKKYQIAEEDAILLTKQLFLGTSSTSFSSELTFKELKENITSEKGTTASGLEILQEKNSLKNLFELAIKKAEERSKELSK